MNSLECMPGPVRLPFAPRLRRLRAPRGQRLWLAKRDLSNCFYLFGVEEARWPRQVIGPRIPRSWLDNLEEDQEADYAPVFASWCSGDLSLAPGACGEALDEATFCQFAMVAVMMGDIGAVTVIQEAHTRFLLAHRILSPAEMVGGHLRSTSRRSSAMCSSTT